jgi:hypothetical protein
MRHAAFGLERLQFLYLKRRKLLEEFVYKRVL